MTGTGRVLGKPKVRGECVVYLGCYKNNSDAHCYKTTVNCAHKPSRWHGSNWADKRQADLYCTKRNEPLCTPLMSDCPIIHTVDRQFLRRGNWFSGARHVWSAALIQ